MTEYGNPMRITLSAEEKSWVACQAEIHGTSQTELIRNLVVTGIEEKRPLPPDKPDGPFTESIGIRFNSYQRSEMNYWAENGADYVRRTIDRERHAKPKRVAVTRPKYSRPKKVSEEQIDEIVSLYNQGTPYKELAEKFHVSKGTISKYINGRRRRKKYDDQSDN